MKCFFTTSVLSAMVGGRALSAFAIGPGGDFEEPEDCRADVHGLAAGGAVLVRPDGHVAWRSRSSSPANFSPPFGVAKFPDSGVVWGGAAWFPEYPNAPRSWPIRN